MTHPTGAPAPAFNGVHLQDVEPRDDGTFRAVTVFDKGGNGILVWAGYVAPICAREACEVHASGFIITERVSFMFWDDLWRYFRDREYAQLIARLRPEFASAS